MKLLLDGVTEVAFSEFWKCHLIVHVLSADRTDLLPDGSSDHANIEPHAMSDDDATTHDLSEVSFDFEDRLGTIHDLDVVVRDTKILRRHLDADVFVEFVANVGILDRLPSCVDDCNAADAVAPFLRVSVTVFLELDVQSEWFFDVVEKIRVRCSLCGTTASILRVDQNGSHISSHHEGRGWLYLNGRHVVKMYCEDVMGDWIFESSW